jgi:hypothetical protein
MIVFEPVWISSDEHLEKFYAVRKQASSLEKIFGDHRLPPNFPYLEMSQGIVPSIPTPHSLKNRLREMSS